APAAILAGVERADRRTTGRARHARVATREGVGRTTGRSAGGAPTHAVAGVDTCDALVAARGPARRSARRAAAAVAGVAAGALAAAGATGLGARRAGSARGRGAGACHARQAARVAAGRGTGPHVVRTPLLTWPGLCPERSQPRRRH